MDPGYQGRLFLPRFLIKSRESYTAAHGLTPLLFVLNVDQLDNAGDTEDRGVRAAICFSPTALGVAFHLSATAAHCRHTIDPAAASQLLRGNLRNL